MKIRDQFLFAIRAMTDRRLRTTLTIIGIVIGPATIVSLDAATQGYSNASTAQFNSLGANTLFLSSSARGFSLTVADIAQIQALPGVASVLPYQMLAGTITQGGGSVSVQIIATDLENLTSVFPKLSVQAGSYPSSTDLAGAIIGNSVAYPDITNAVNVSVNQVLSVSDVGRGFSFGPTFGQTITTASTTKSFIVRGILNAYGQGFLISPDTAVFVPLAEGEALLHSYDYTGMMVVASSNGIVNNVDSELTALYGNDVRVTSVSSILSTITSVTQSTGTLLEAVGSISVLVAFIAIMTTEFTSVIERTKEIGILKALGATSRTIMFNFISEALATGFIGGLIGAAIGSGLSFLIIGLLAGRSRTAGFPSTFTTVGGARRIGSGGGGGVFFTSGGGGSFAAAAPIASSSSTTSTVPLTPALTPELILLAILLATIVGGLAGVLPAWRASRLPPVEALRTA